MITTNNLNLHPHAMLTNIIQSLSLDNNNPAEVCQAIAAKIEVMQQEGILEKEDLEVLAKNQFTEGLKKFTSSLLPKYESIWQLLDKPVNFEEWYYRLGNLRGNEKKEYNKLYGGSMAAMWECMTDTEKAKYKILN
jgi:hypothetical protein